MSNEQYEAWQRVFSLALMVIGLAGIIFVPVFWALTGRAELAFLPFFGTLAGVGQGLNVLREIRTKEPGGTDGA